MAVAESSSRSPETRTAAALVPAMVVLQLTGSMAYPIAKYGLAIIEPFTFAFYRFVLASVVLMAITLLKKHDRPVERRDFGRIVLLGVLIIPFNQTLFLAGQSLTAAGHGALLFATTPIWVFVLALFHSQETFRWRRAVGIAMAFVGVAVVMLAGALEVGTRYLFGDLILLVSVLAWAWYTVLGKPLVVKYGALRTTAYALTAGSILYFPFGLYRAIVFDYSQATPAAWGSVVYMAIGLSLVVYVLWYWILKYWEASRLAVYHNVQPILASIVAWFWLGESLGLSFIVGGSIVILGVIIAEIRNPMRGFPHK